MRIAPTGSHIRRAERRLLRRFFVVVALVFLAIVALTLGHRLLALW